MPKELTHLIFSDLALKGIEETCPETGKVLRDNYDIYLLGSIIPDTPFYDLSFFNKKKSITFLSKKIHSNRGGLSSQFISRTLEEGLNGGRESFAFSCGIISHQWADSVFHPFIVHFTGNFSDPDFTERRKAQARHRFLEGLIDLKLMSEPSIQSDLTPSRTACRLQAARAFTFSFVRSILPGENDEAINELNLRLHKVCSYQLKLLGLYDKTFFKALILLLNRLWGYNYEHYAGLLYADKDYLSLPLLNEEVVFNDPWSAMKMKKSVAGLTEEVVEKMKLSISRYGAARKDMSSLNPALFDEILPGCREEKRDEIIKDSFATREVAQALNRFIGKKG